MVAQSELVCCLISCHHGHFRFRDVEMSAAIEDRKHVLSVPETLDSGVRLHEGQAANHHEAVVATCSSNKWLVDEVFDIISVDWWTWFGTLCLLLWLLYLIVL